MNFSLVKVWEQENGSIQEESVLGIKTQVFTDAILSGIAQYTSVNKFHPITAGGSRAWEEIVASFRQMVVDQGMGWKSIHRDGMAQLVNADQQLTIVVTSGDSNTGFDNDVQPRTRNQKGQATKNIVEANYPLFEDTTTIDKIQSNVDSHQTWVFLYTIDKKKSEVRFELSLPTETQLSGAKGKLKISQWSQRFLFEPVPFEGQMSKPTPPTFTEDSDFFAPIKK
ncbi:hypothetical protein [Vibrio alfacsensis]|uniref:hypothetical protein n=1 Tax=Vibrio alfacsensis TaxID=1074311 RepID=UPI001BF0A1E5|nr:hypothetical protein [Vibrio alfacsensis]BCN24556.1 hypothetical protein VYA_17480 [Vibrio alfacsensis]